MRGLVRRGHRSDGKPFPDFKSDHAGGEGRRDHQSLEQSDRDDHRKGTRRAPGLDPKKIEYFVGPDRSRIRRAYICSRHEFEGSAQFIVDHQTRGRSGRVSEDRRLPIDELFIETQPAHLQKSSQQKLNEEERDHQRAQLSASV